MRFRKHDEVPRTLARHFLLVQKWKKVIFENDPILVQDNSEVRVAIVEAAGEWILIRVLENNVFLEISIQGVACAHYRVSQYTPLLQLNSAGIPLQQRKSNSENKIRSETVTE